MFDYNKFIMDTKIETVINTAAPAPASSLGLLEFYKMPMYIFNKEVSKMDRSKPLTDLHVPEMPKVHNLHEVCHYTPRNYLEQELENILSKYEYSLEPCKDLTISSMCIEDPVYCLLKGETFFDIFTSKLVQTEIVQRIYKELKEQQGPFSKQSLLALLYKAVLGATDNTDAFDFFLENELDSFTKEELEILHRKDKYEIAHLAGLTPQGAYAMGEEVNGFYSTVDDYHNYLFMNAEKSPDHNPALFRVDKEGRLMERSKYKDTSSEYGWTLNNAKCFKVSGDPSQYVDARNLKSTIEKDLDYVNGKRRVKTETVPCDQCDGLHAW